MRVQQRPGEQELLAEDVVLDLLPAGVGGLGLDPQELLAVVPLVQGLGLVEALVALEPDQLAARGAGQRLGQLRLAHARRALHEHRLAELPGEKGHQRGALVGEVSGAGQAVACGLDACPVRRSSVAKDTFAPLAALLLVMSDFLDPRGGPDQRGDFRVSPTFFLALVVGGFVIGTSAT